MKGAWKGCVMNAKDRAAAWAVDQLDPDNWIEIPEFDVNLSAPIEI